MGFFEVPVVERKPWGIICAVTNILPGLGTLIAAGRTGSIKQYVFGMVQFVLFFLLITWLWSIVWGVLIFLKSTPGEAPATATSTTTPTVSKAAKARAKKA